MRPIFVGNFEYDTRQSDLERLFSKYGDVERVDMKSDHCGWFAGLRGYNWVLIVVMENVKCIDFIVAGDEGFQELLPLEDELPSAFYHFCAIEIASLLHIAAGFAFVYFVDERDGRDAIRGLDNIPFGYDRRKLSVEWARGERGRHRDGSKPGGNQRPTKTLFVINFDPLRTEVRDLERHFEPYGKITSIRIRRNFGFVQFATLEEATKALECTHMSKLFDRVISVEYALRDDDEGDDRDRLASPRRGGGYVSRRESPYARPRSPAFRRARPSPDYGRPRTPVYDRYAPPAYDRPSSPEYGRYRSRSPVRRSRT
ncbi:Serine/arginine-rich splicing factor RS31-like protein [Drosera capensis]